MINAILACDKDWGIGKDGDLPWPKNSADLQWFKQCTDGCTVVMGRKTWESLPKKPLPNRRNIVVSSSEVDGVQTITADKINFTCQLLSSPVWIIGGAQLVKTCLPIINEFWLSRIQDVYDCDVFLPKDLIEEQYTLVESGLTSEVYVDIWRKR